MAIKKRMSIAEYAMHRWMVEHGFSDDHFTLSVSGNEGVISNRYGDVIGLGYDSAKERVYVIKD